MIIQSWIKKKKNALSFARMFSSYNKRFFTLNLEKLLLYYSGKANYEFKDITLIPIKVNLKLEWIALLRVFRKLNEIIQTVIQKDETVALLFLH